MRLINVSKYGVAMIYKFALIFLLFIGNFIHTCDNNETHTNIPNSQSNLHVFNYEKAVNTLNNSRIQVYSFRGACIGSLSGLGTAIALIISLKDQMLPPTIVLLSIGSLVVQMTIGSCAGCIISKTCC